MSRGTGAGGHPCTNGDGAMDRRTFVRRLPVVAGVAAAGGPLILGACGGAAYLTPRDLGGRIAVPGQSVQGGGVFVAHPADERPIFAWRDETGEVVAVHARCTHRGCQPEPVAERLVCPCHGSEFALDGRVLEGPAREPLRRFRTTVEGDDVMIWLTGGAE